MCDSICSCIFCRVKHCGLLELEDIFVKFFLCFNGFKKKGFWVKKNVFSTFLTIKVKYVHEMIQSFLSSTKNYHFREQRVWICVYVRGSMYLILTIFLYLFIALPSGSLCRLYAIAYKLFLPIQEPTTEDPSTRIRFCLKTEFFPLWFRLSFTCNQWRRPPKTRLFSNRSPEWRLLKKPFCCTSVNGIKTERFLGRIPSRCWIPWPVNAHSPTKESLYFVFVWTFRNDWKTQRLDGDFSNTEKKSLFSN